MRVITGTARGKKLCTPEGHDVRPTVDRVKEAVFSSLQFDIEGRIILDLFAGSGQLGIEALSRGAKHCFFVDVNKKSLEAIKSNIKSCEFEKNSTVFESDSFLFLNKTDEKFDIAFLDPPYNNGLVDKAMSLIVNKMSDYGVIVCEHSEDDVLSEKYGKFSLVKTARYGIVYVSYFRRTED